jgi:hypothetical protein
MICTITFTERRERMRIRHDKEYICDREYIYDWAIPKDITVDAVTMTRLAYKAIQSVNELIDRNNGEPVLDRDIENALSYYGFGISKWGISFNPYKQAWDLYNPVYARMKEKVTRNDKRRSDIL